MPSTCCHCLMYLRGQALYLSTIRFKAKTDVSWDARLMYNGRSPTSASIDRWQHHPYPKFWFFSEEREFFFSRNNIHSKLLKTDHGIFVTMDFTSTCKACTQGSSIAIGIEFGLFGQKLNAITTRLPTAKRYRST